MVNFEDPAETDRRDKMIFLEWAKKNIGNQSVCPPVGTVLTAIFRSVKTAPMGKNLSCNANDCNTGCRYLPK